MVFLIVMGRHAADRWVERTKALHDEGLAAAAVQQLVEHETVATHDDADVRMDVSVFLGGGSARLPRPSSAAIAAWRLFGLILYRSKNAGESPR